MVSYSSPLPQTRSGDNEGEQRPQTQSVLCATVTPRSCQVEGRYRRTKVAELGSFLTFPTLHWLSHPTTQILSMFLYHLWPLGESDARGRAAGRLTVIMSFSTQSGATLWRCVRCSWRWILLLSMSWHRGQRSMGCTECCVMACTRSRLTSALLYLQ